MKEQQFPFQSPSSSDSSPSLNLNINEEGVGEDPNISGKNNNIVYRIHEHVKMGGKVGETVKEKLRLGGRIIKHGGRGNIFKQTFGVGDELLKASQCYLSTTAGPIAGLLFISTHNLAFASHAPLTITSPSLTLTAPYKVLIPLMKIQRAGQSENVNKPSQKYIQIVTEDNFEFWFMGFLRYEKAFAKLQKAISMSKVTSSDKLNDCSSEK